MQPEHLVSTTRKSRNKQRSQALATAAPCRDKSPHEERQASDAFRKARLRTASRFLSSMLSAILSPLRSLAKAVVSSVASITRSRSTSSALAHQAQYHISIVLQLQPPPVQLVVAYMLRENQHTTNLHQLHSLTVHATVWAQYLSLAFTSSGLSPGPEIFQSGMGAAAATGSSCPTTVLCSSRNLRVME